MEASDRGMRGDILDGLFEKDWVPYEGPRGGEGWQNPATDEIVYDDEPPGEREAGAEGQTQQTLPGIEPEPVSIETPQWAQVDDINRAMGEVFGSEVSTELQWEYEDDMISMGRTSSKFRASYYMRMAEDWMDENADNREVAEFLDRIDEYRGASPFPESEDAPDFIDPARAENVERFEEAFDVRDHGVTAGSMFVAEGMTDPEDKAFVTNFNADTYGDVSPPSDGQRAATAADFLQGVGIEVPEHHYEEGEYLSVAACEGRAVKDITHPSTLNLDRDELVEFGAAVFLAGEKDAHGGNVFIDKMAWGNDFVSVDLDHAGSDLTDDGSGGWGAVDKFKRTTKRLSFGLEPTNPGQVVSDAIERSHELADDIDPERVFGDEPDNEYEENIIANIEAAQEGEFLSQFMYPEYDDE